MSSTAIAQPLCTIVVDSLTKNDESGDRVQCSSISLEQILSALPYH